MILPLCLPSALYTATPLCWTKLLAGCHALWPQTSARSLVWFLSAFADLLKATFSCGMSFRPGQFISHRTDFHEILYLGIFRQSADKIQFRLKSDKNNGYFTGIPEYISNNI
jgi:hypothetical protein